MSVPSLPLTFAERQATGALNLYSTVGQPWCTTTAPAARGLGGQAAAVLANAVRLANSELTHHHPQQAPGNREVIGQAKGMLTARQAITADEAADILRRVSEHSGRKVRKSPPKSCAGSRRRRLGLNGTGMARPRP